MKGRIGRRAAGGMGRRRKTVTDSHALEEMEAYHDAKCRHSVDSPTLNNADLFGSTITHNS